MRLNSYSFHHSYRTDINALVGQRVEDENRVGEILKMSKYVSPTELENIILQLPAVADVAVVGIPDTLAGELPRAFVVLRPEAKLTEEQICDYVEPKVAPFKKLAGGVHFISSIPRNPSGKILRHQLKVLGARDKELD